MRKRKSQGRDLAVKNALIAEDLKKNYGSILALDNISFNVLNGEIFGFLGPNGAGKTTTTNIFTGIIRPTSGVAKIFTFDISKEPVSAKRLIGIVPQEPFVYGELSAWDNLMFKAKMHNLGKEERRRKASKLLKEFTLYERRDNKVSTYSGGMKKLLTMAIALVHKPKILFLDEPTTGLDVRSSRKIREKIKKLNRTGVTIFLTTHNMEEASQLCDRVAIIDNGHIISIGTPDKLKKTLQKELLIELELKVEPKIQERIKKSVQSFKRIREIKTIKKGLKILIEDQSILSDLFHFIHENEIIISSIYTIKPTLEEAFVRIIDQMTE
ncbi:MAG: ATP-binding cassette domain-containing protein [Promethearchaeia archaeon]